MEGEGGGGSDNHTFLGTLKEGGKERGTREVCVFVPNPAGKIGAMTIP